MALLLAVFFPLVIIAEIAGWSDESLSVPVYVLLTLGCIMHAEMAGKAMREKRRRTAGKGGSRTRTHRRP